MAMSFLRIGDLARLGGVSIRMLRHYHEIGLLTPDRVDEVSAYRLYHSDQLDMLHTIVLLRDLGLSLPEILQIMHEDLSVDEIRKILLNRRASAVTEIRTAQTAIEQLDAYLETLSDSGAIRPRPPEITAIDVQVKPVEAQLVAQLSAVAESWASSDIGPTIQPLYQELIGRMRTAHVSIDGQSTAWYEDTPEGTVQVNATLAIGNRPSAEASTLSFEIAELPALAQVASTIHLGSMDECSNTYEALLNWIEDHRFRPLGYGREIDIECGPDGPASTEIQIAIESPEESK